ncbi:MAG: HEAT repeat domain-containing protein [Anaerolineae bacterium]|nr:HEAT repeat domain-containing protein [Anaerolineae bacterium]
MSDPDPAAVKQFLSELRDYNKEKRRTAVMKLGMVGGDQAILALIMAVKNNNEDLIVRGRAALMLGKLGDPRAVDPLIQALHAPGHQTPLYAAQALGKLGDRRAIQPLLNIAMNSNDKVREAALDSLKRLGYEDENEPGSDESLETEPTPEL